MCKRGIKTNGAGRVRIYISVDLIENVARQAEFVELQIHFNLIIQNTLFTTIVLK